jgi:hypothetical protein
MGGKPGFGIGDLGFGYRGWNYGEVIEADSNLKSQISNPESRLSLKTAT